MAPRRSAPAWLRALELEPVLFAIWAGVATAFAARGFFSAREMHLSFAEVARRSLDPSDPIRHLPHIFWSAPLDDTFIHFDFARSFAELRPFEWTRGGGYSSGATSWSYPLLLAFGVLAGLEGQSLGLFSDLLAMLGVFGFLLGVRPLFRGLLPGASWLVPPAIAIMGVLGWSLFSGMELPLFLMLWATGCATGANLALASQNGRSLRAERRQLVWLGTLGFLLVATRPEALLTVLLFAPVLLALRHPGDLSRRTILLLILGPALGITLFRAGLNLLLTGSHADAGAWVKLLSYHPFMEPRSMGLAWLENVGFQLTRLTVYHAADHGAFGAVLWVLVLVSLTLPKTRVIASLLFAQTIGWILLVASNEYVRYQNDRYTMPALAWLVLMACLGVAGLVDHGLRTLARGRTWFGGLSLGSALVFSSIFVAHQLPRLFQQRWLFGRACRNIAEQQMTAGLLLRNEDPAEARRVLVGDAGAIAYFSELPGLDAIGLGGTFGLPFARANRLGIGATIELLEHIPEAQRPRLMVLYPSWWGLLPVWFGQYRSEIRIRGNVICGADDKVIYDARWHGLDAGESPLFDMSGRTLVDRLDFADITSELRHAYQLSSRHAGYVVMKLLADPHDPGRDVFDAGRLVFDGVLTRFVVTGLVPHRPAELWFRLAPLEETQFSVKVGGREVGRVELDPADHWQETRVVIPPRLIGGSRLDIELVPDQTEHILYHLFVTVPDSELGSVDPVLAPPDDEGTASSAGEGSLEH